MQLPRALERGDPPLVFHVHRALALRKFRGRAQGAPIEQSRLHKNVRRIRGCAAEQRRLARKPAVD